MGFFSDILNPLTPLKPLTTDEPWKVINPLAAVNDPEMKAKLNGGDGSQGLPNPDGATTNAPGSMSWQGDSADPAYGSFTKPFDVNEFYKYQDPGYWWRLQQGQQAVQNGAAAKDGALSGAALKDLMGYNQDMASTEYGNAFNRYQTTQGNIFSRLSSLAGLGQNAAAGVGNQGVQLAGQAGQALQNAGTAAGGGIVGAGNALAGGATNYGAYRYATGGPTGISNPTTGIADNYQNTPIVTGNV